MTTIQKKLLGLHGDVEFKFLMIAVQALQLSVDKAVQYTTGYHIGKEAYTFLGFEYAHNLVCPSYRLLPIIRKECSDGKE